MFPWGTCQVVVTISIVFGFYTIHSGSVGAAKGPRIEHFCRFRLFLGYFSSLWRSPCILCIQIFSKGTYQIMTCIWTVLGNLEIHAGFVGYSIRAQNWAFLPLKGLFKVPIKLSNPAECFLKVPNNYCPKEGTKIDLQKELGRFDCSLLVADCLQVYCRLLAGLFAVRDQ